MCKAGTYAQYLILVLLKSPARLRFWEAEVSQGPHLLGRSGCLTMSGVPWQIL